MENDVQEAFGIVIIIVVTGGTVRCVLGGGRWGVIGVGVVWWWGRGGVGWCGGVMAVDGMSIGERVGRG